MIEHLQTLVQVPALAIAGEASVLAAVGLPRCTLRPGEPLRAWCPQAERNRIEVNLHRRRRGGSRRGAGGDHGHGPRRRRDDRGAGQRPRDRSGGPEGRRILPDFTVEENLRLGAHLLTRRQCEARIHEALAAFPLLQDRRRQRAGSLSGGQQQMLALARALMTEPKLLLLDEPSLGLSPITTREVFHAIQRVREQGTTVVLVEQKSIALKLADHGYVLRDGRLDLDGPARALLGDERLQRVYLGG